MPGAVVGLGLASNGWRVFPVVRNDKFPVIEEWTNKATTDSKAINAWATKYRGCNWGIATGKASGIFVIDIDPRNGGWKTLEALGKDGKIFPETYTVISPSRGFHFYYRYPAHMLVKSSPILFKKWGKGIDCQSDGKFVVGPCGYVKNEDYPEGGFYWFTPKRLAEAPQWLLEVVEKPPEPVVVPLPVPEGRAMLGDKKRQAYADGAFRNELLRLSQAVEGGRNIALNTAALKLGAFVNVGALDRQRVEAELYNEALRLGLGSGEAKATIGSGLRASQRKQRDPFAAMTTISFQANSRGAL
jgi:hypothetical protein